MIRITALAAALVLTAAPSFAALIPNGLSNNGLSNNGIFANGIGPNALYPNALYPNGIFANGASATRAVLPALRGIVLPSGVAVER